MGFVRSSLRQHWHVYEVLEDTSLTAYTPAIGYATIVVSVCVLLFFALVGMVVWIAELGNHDHDDHGGDSTSVAAK
jgi:cytochrome bd-type quinol oxidase subunit 1